MESTDPEATPKPSNLALVEAEKERWKAEWDQKSPDQKQKSVEATLEQNLEMLGLSSEDLADLKQGAFSNIRLKWESDWQHARNQETPPTAIEVPEKPGRNEES